MGVSLGTVASVPQLDKRQKIDGWMDRVLKPGIGTNA